jgi:hypothetical protein
VLVLKLRRRERERGGWGQDQHGGTNQRKFGGALRAVKMMNWRTGTQSILYGACNLRQWFWSMVAQGRRRRRRTLLR